MVNVPFPTLIASWISLLQQRLPWVLLGTGLLILSLALLVLMLSRLGHARPIAKCVALSVYAHFLLLGCAYMINLFHDPPGNGMGPGVRITLIDDIDASIDRSDLVQPLSDSPPVVDQPVLTPDPVSLEPGLIAPEFRQPDLDFPSEIEVEVPPQELNPPEPADLFNSAPKPMAAAPIAPPTADESAPGAADATRGREVIEAVEGTADRVQAAESQQQPQSLSDADVNSQTGDLAAANKDRIQAVFASDSNTSKKSSSSAAADPVGDTKTQTGADVQLHSHYRARQSATRLQNVIAQGGSRETEQAVRDALAWISSAQESDGRWSTRAWAGGTEIRDFSNVHPAGGEMNADTALTGLAILALLGAGFTHDEGEYQEEVGAGLRFLCASQSTATGSLAGDAGRFVAMYCHGIATLALSEAYAMTQDQRLRPYLERAIRYTIHSQHPTTGGWRYVPGDAGDTSQFGWQVMSLISARNGGLSIPQTTWNGANRWLRRVSLGQHGGLACYSSAKQVPSITMTAEALTCRLFLQGRQDRAAIDEGAESILRHGLGLEPMNLYYYYYATVAMHQLQGSRWNAWNEALTRRLLATQRTDGSLAGSWDTDTVWGRAGGRVYTTALATLCLESYYRYLPIGQLHGRQDRTVARPRNMQPRSSIQRRSIQRR